MFDMEKPSDHQEENVLVDSAWEKSQANKVIEGLKLGRSLAEILPEVPGFLEAFSHPLDTLDCSDGRVVSGHKLGLAGVGILLDESDRQILSAALKEKGIKITGHDNCGAAGLAHPGDPNSDSYGYANAKALAEQTGNPYDEVHKENFRFPFHDERGLVVDKSGRFDCANWSEFPAQFISSAPYFGLSDGYIKTEIAALTNIALGDHGFSDRFTEDSPFYIIVSADNQADLDHLKLIATEAVTSFANRVKVEGFVTPEAKK